MKRGFPLLTLLSLFPACLLWRFTYPLWFAALDNDDTGKAGYFVAVAAVISTGLTAGAGAFVGAILAVVAQVRRETLLPLRVVSLACNIAAFGYELYVFLALPRS